MTRGRRPGALAATARIAGRMAIFAIAACVLVLVAIQFEGIVAKNVAMTRELDASRADLAALAARVRVQRRTIARLSDPRGAIPEIHEKLRLVGPNERLIFVRGGERATP